MDTTTLTALALNCSLKPSPAESSTQLIADQVLDALAEHGVSGSSIRLADLHVKSGVEADMGDGDDWPSVRERILAADILVLSTPTWMGHMSSIAQQVLERLDAELSLMDDRGLPELYDKVAVVAVVGNEDGAHAITAALYQGLNDVGFTIPAQGGTYWNGEAMHTVDYKDLDAVPDEVASATAGLAASASHLAALLKTNRYPAP
jgi:multimeric flavodoxin WrbA